MAPVKLLFVCLGNICRSPAAENLMNHALEQRGLVGQVVCDSAGTSNYHIGARPDRRMTAALAQDPGLAAVGSARQFHRGDFEAFDLILAMDRDNYRDILALDREGIYGDRVKLMSEFCRQAKYRDMQDVPDPYYGGDAGFRLVIDLLTDACDGLLEQLHVEGKVSA